MDKNINPMDNTPDLLCAVPVELVEEATGVIVIRGAISFKVEGVAAEGVNILISAALDRPTSEDDLIKLFIQEDRECASQLIAELRHHRILLPLREIDGGRPEGENGADIFYWNFGARAKDVLERLGKIKVAVIGVNPISRELLQALHNSGVTGLETIDVFAGRGANFFGQDGSFQRDSWPASLPRPLSYEVWKQCMSPDAYDCFIVTSDSSGTHFLREWNRYCVQTRREFLPVQLNRLVGYIGPFYIPGETACYECLWRRENANLPDPEARQMADWASQRAPGLNGYLSPMASVLGDFAAVEIVKRFSRILPYRVGDLLEVKMLAGEMTPRKVLKVPRCPVCSTLNKVSAVNLSTFDFVHLMAGA